MKNGTGLELIREERVRQVVDFGHSSVHDDGHVNGELVRAAVCYAMADRPDLSIRFMSRLWPWEDHFPDPEADRVENLAKAGALIAAEIDRLLRIAERTRIVGVPLGDLEAVLDIQLVDDLDHTVHAAIGRLRMSLESAKAQFARGE